MPYGDEDGTAFDYDDISGTSAHPQGGHAIDHGVRPSSFSLISGDLELQGELIKSSPPQSFCERVGRVLGVTAEIAWGLFQNFLHEMAWTLIAFLHWNARFEKAEEGNFWGTKENYLVDGAFEGELCLPTLVMLLTYMMVFLLNCCLSPQGKIPFRPRYLLASSGALATRGIVQKYAREYFLTIEPDPALANHYVSMCTGLVQSATQTVLLKGAELMEERHSLFRNANSFFQPNCSNKIKYLLRTFSSVLIFTPMGFAWNEIYFKVEQDDLPLAAKMGAIAGGAIASNVFSQWALSKLPELGQWIQGKFVGSQTTTSFDSQEPAGAGSPPRLSINSNSDSLNFCVSLPPTKGSPVRASAKNHPAFVSNGSSEKLTHSTSVSPSPSHSTSSNSVVSQGGFRRGYSMSSQLTASQRLEIQHEYGESPQCSDTSYSDVDSKEPSKG
jgi:hypothetical protein